jgi:hypothetical protein
VVTAITSPKLSTNNIYFDQIAKKSKALYLSYFLAFARAQRVAPLRCLT